MNMHLPQLVWGPFLSHINIHHHSHPELDHIHQTPPSTSHTQIYYNSLHPDLCFCFQLCHVSTTQMLVVCAPLKHKPFHYLTSSTSLCAADGKHTMLRSLICCSFTRYYPVPDTMCASPCFNQVTGTTLLHEILPCCLVGNETFNMSLYHDLASYWTAWCTQKCVGGVSS